MKPCVRACCTPRLFILNAGLYRGSTQKRGCLGAVSFLPVARVLFAGANSRWGCGGCTCCCPRRDCTYNCVYRRYSFMVLFPRGTTLFVFLSGCTAIHDMCAEHATAIATAGVGPPTVGGAVFDGGRSGGGRRRDWRSGSGVPHEHPRLPGVSKSPSARPAPGGALGWLPLYNAS